MKCKLSDGRLVDFDSKEWIERPEGFDRSLADPLSVVVPFLDQDPKWLILCGLGNDNDALPAIKRWPDVKVIGIDIDQRSLDEQRKRGWRDQDVLVQAALSDNIGFDDVNMDNVCHASLHPMELVKVESINKHKVVTITLDDIDNELGPFGEAVLWIDLEGYDYKALQGAKKLLASGRVLLVGVEIQYRLNNDGMFNLLAEMGYELVHQWFAQWWGHNEIWRIIK